ncbi:O-antigen ligase family protein [Turicibacter sp. TA25]|uniref:O-antigen ligase family protein n=2 Tax=Bacillota TaxID=1239 RepID=UPI0021D4BC0F|nr:hypothetical protein [Turicibacter sp. TA25]MCU7204085.1 hypothetical protein [Turicibacter sp. TA25]
MYIVIVYELFFILSYITEKIDYLFIIKILYKLALIYIILTDLLIFINPHYFMKNGEYYLVGNKFSVGYLHLQLIVLFFMYTNLNKKFKFSRYLIGILYILLTIIIAIKVDCMTTIIGLFILLLFLFFIPRKITTKPDVFLLILLVSNLALLSYDRILNIPSIQYFITQILNRDISLTGRTVIYDNIPKLMQGKVLLGYGYGSSYETWMKYINLPNSQNALIDIIIEQGLFAVIFLLIIIYFVIKRINLKDKNIIHIYYPALVMLYVYSILGAVEITINISYIFWLSLIYSSCSMQKKAKLK